LKAESWSCCAATVYAMSENLAKLLLRLSEAGEPAVLWGRQAKPFLGRTFDGLLTARVLVEQMPATEWPVCAGCECELDARIIEMFDGRSIASCPNDAASDVVLDADDIRSFHIDQGRLVHGIALASGFKAEPHEVVPGVWSLGPTSTGRATFLAFMIAAAQQPGLLTILKASAQRAPITLLAPALPHGDRKRFDEADVHIVALQDAICIEAESEFAADLSRFEPGPAAAPRLVVIRSTQLVILDGVSRPLAEQPFQLLCLLAERARSTGGAPVGTREIDGQIWGTSIHLVARQARDVVRELRDGLAEGSPDPKPVRDLIENRRSRGYLLALTPEEIDIRP